MDLFDVPVEYQCFFMHEENGPNVLGEVTINNFASNGWRLVSIHYFDGRWAKVWMVRPKKEGEG